MEHFSKLDEVLLQAITETEASLRELRILHLEARVQLARLLRHVGCLLLCVLSRRKQRRGRYEIDAALTVERFEAGVVVDAAVEELRRRLWSSNSLREQAEVLELLTRRLGSASILSGPQGAPVEIKTLLEEIYRRGLQQEDWNVARRCAGAMGLVHPQLDDALIDLLSRQNFTAEQLKTCRDIRRRGKNKLTAENSRKRKFDLVKDLEERCQEARKRGQQLEREQAESRTGYLEVSGAVTSRPSPR